MKLLLEWESGSIVLDPGSSYVLGRDSSSDIPIANNRISRSHLRFSFEGDSWEISDLETTNGSTLSGKRFTKVKIDKESRINIGGTSGVSIKVRPLSKTSQGQTGEAKTRKSLDKTQIFNTPTATIKETNSPRRIRLGQRIRIGRDSDNDWAIDDINVSRNHAEIVQNPAGDYELIDMKSMNGTFLNGAPIRREKMNYGDVISVCGHNRIFTSDGLESVEGIEGISIRVEDVNFSIGNKVLLQDVSFSLGPRTLTAIIGPSGAGKSTLLGVLTGRTKPGSGRVMLSQQDLHENFQSVSQRIGSVPQADILHTRLTVRQALQYGARLRLPSDVDRAQRNQRVEEVMAKLELTERADLRIDRLSGGQRKRASIGLELLTSPELLALDEPTSGLDPGLDAHVMETLRKIADDGQTVVLVTHSVDNLNFCDNVILMASGGKVAYAGPASTVFSKLGKKNWAEVFKFLASPEALLLATPKREMPTSNELKTGAVAKRRQSALKQMMTMSLRYMRVISSDRFYLALLTLIPVIIGAISYFAGSDLGLGPGRKNQLGITYNPFARGSILVLTLGAIFIGLSTSIQEIVKEDAIRKREQSVGVRATSYVLSKIAVLSLITSMQIIVFATIVFLGRPLPANGLLFSSSRIEIYFILVVLGLASMLLGLVISSLLSSSEQAMPALVGMTMIQVVLSGALPLQTSGVINTISEFVPSYWATNALSASIDIVQLSVVTNKASQARWESSLDNLMDSLSIVGIFSLAFILITLIRVSRNR